MNTVTVACDVSLLARADLLLLLADALRPPAVARERLLAVSPADPPTLIESAGLPCDLLGPLQQLLNAAAQTTEQDWSDEYHRLFEGAMVCPANETAFIRRDKGAIIGDLAGYYRAFGWQPTASGGEKADHLVTELEFLAMLLAMAAAAPADKAPGAAEVTSRAVRSFVADHLGDWIAPVCSRIEGWTALPYYRDAARALAAVWQALATAHAWPAPTATAEFTESPLDDDPREECGAADLPIQLNVRRS